MIDHATIKTLLSYLTTDKNDTLVSNMLTGFLAGVSLSIKDPKLARTIDHNLRTEWSDTHTSVAAVDPGAVYGPGVMGERLMTELKKMEGKSN